LVCRGNGTSAVFPQCFDGFIVDASISAQPLFGVAPCIPRFWGLVGFTAVHTGMEHLFPKCFGVDPPLSAFPAYTSILTYSDPGVHGVRGPTLKNWCDLWQ